MYMICWVMSLIFLFWITWRLTKNWFIYDKIETEVWGNVWWKDTLFLKPSYGHNGYVGFIPLKLAGVQSLPLWHGNATAYPSQLSVARSGLPLRYGDNSIQWILIRRHRVYTPIKCHSRLLHFEERHLSCNPTMSTMMPWQARWGTLRVISAIAQRC